MYAMQCMSVLRKENTENDWEMTENDNKAGKNMNRKMNITITKKENVTRK